MGKKKKKEERNKQKATPWNKTRNLRNQKTGLEGRAQKTRPEVQKRSSSFWSLRCELPAECKQLAPVGLLDAGKL